jgi:hypothetical protein
MDINVYGAIRSMAGEGKAAYASQVYDESLNQFQSEINRRVKDGVLLEISQQEFNAIFD